MQFLGTNLGYKEAKKNKRGQVTLFVIIALVIISAVIFFILYRPSLSPAPSVSDPSSYIEKCAKDSANDAINLISSQGGLINPENYILFDGKRITYLCYTTEYYKGCVNQQPLFKQTVESQITQKIKPEIQNCVDDVVTEYRGKGYSVSAGTLNVETILQPNKVLINVKVPITFTKGDTVRYEKFNSILSSPLYELISLSQDIVNSEINSGDFNQLTYMLLHNDMSVDKTRKNFATIYTLRDIRTGKQFRFATKSWETPGGLFG